jgi:SAM-dependent methyltransferase
MEGSYPSQLRIWNGPMTSEVADRPPFRIRRCNSEAHPSLQAAGQLYALETLDPSPTPKSTPEGVEPFTLQWFLEIEYRRLHRRARWIPRLLEFAKHPGETLLGIGNGLGTDWVQYARNGTNIIVCCPQAEELAHMRRNFELRGLPGRFLHASPCSLPLENATIDVVCLNNLFADNVEPQALVQEIYRVLKPGGKVLAVVPAFYDVNFYYHLFFPWLSWLGHGKAREAQASVRFTARDLRRLFRGFVEHRIHKRQLRHSEVPHVWRFLPLSLLERLLGRILVLKAFKPLTTIAALQAAA